jgi:hypothetical protein
MTRAVSFVVVWLRAGGTRYRGQRFDRVGGRPGGRDRGSAGGRLLLQRDVAMGSRGDFSWWFGRTTSHSTHGQRFDRAGGTRIGGPFELTTGRGAKPGGGIRRRGASSGSGRGFYQASRSAGKSRYDASHRDGSRGGRRSSRSKPHLRRISPTPPYWRWSTGFFFARGGVDRMGPSGVWRAGFRVTTVTAGESSLSASTVRDAPVCGEFQVKPGRRAI